MGSLCPPQVVTGRVSDGFDATFVYLADGDELYLQSFVDRAVQ